jgi:hypothetical protein
MYPSCNSTQYTSSCRQTVSALPLYLETDQLKVEECTELSALRWSNLQFLFTRDGPAVQIKFTTLQAHR